MPGKLYKDLDSLYVLEQLDDNEFDFVYLDIPYYSDVKIELHSGDKSIRHQIARTRSISISEVSREQVEEAKKKLERESNSKYSDYVSKVIENSHRLLKGNGILALLCPSHEHSDINYRLILDQYFPSFSVVTIEKLSGPINNRYGNNYNLYFYSKLPDYTFPVLKELAPIESFSEKDEHDYYLKKTSMRTGHGNPNLRYEWHGITPSGNLTWQYPKGKMDSLYAEGRIIIEGNRVFEKYYRSEHPKTVSSVWKYNDSTRLQSFIDSQSIERMFSMFVKEDSRVLCPYERDGKFASIADNQGITWEAVYTPWIEGHDLIQDIPTEHYEIINELHDKSIRDYRTGIVTNTYDINELKARIEQLSSDVKKIQSSIGMDDNSVFSVDSVIEQIHNVVTQAVSSFSIDDCLTEAQDWLDPFWNKLEPESKHFIPTGFLLYNQFSDEQNVDMAPIMIEYCKSLEKELFMKMYYGYINDLIDRKIDVKAAFPEAFDKDNTRVFAEFLSECTTTNKASPEKWQFEIGKMRVVLQDALSKKPKDALIIDFRNYLNQIFDKQFFREKFNDRFHIINKIRNACAHPSIIDNTAVEEGRELIRQKLLILLKHYTDESD